MPENPAAVAPGPDFLPDRAEILTPRALERGAERASLLKRARALLSRRPSPWDCRQCRKAIGLGAPSQTDVARALGISGAALSRMLAKYARLADDELTPARLGADAMNAGRPSPWAFLAEDARVRVKLQQFYLLTCGASSDYMTKDRRTGSASLALEHFADDPLCPPALAGQLRAGRFPKPLLSLIRRITAAVEQRYRGVKHASLNGTVIHRRELVETLADHSTREIVPGDWWVFDDMSRNQPFWFDGPEGPLVGRQGLYGFDICRLWLGVELIGTSRDSYTAAIILRFLRRLFSALGKPRRGVIFEQSVWKANVIHGVRLKADGSVLPEHALERPEMPEAERHLVQAGLKAIGIEVQYTYSPRGKEIEGAFNYLQRVTALRAAGQINLGRHAGEFEAGAKALRRAHAGSHHPAQLGFAGIDEAAAADERSMAWINDRAVRRNPRLAEPGAPLAALRPKDLPVFLPEKRELEIRNGRVTATVAGEPLDFCAPELFAALGNGYRVTVKFDPSEPQIGAAIYNREKSSANHQSYAPGAYIGNAQFMPTVARFDFRPIAERGQGSDFRKRYNKFVRTAFQAVGLPQFRAATLRDGNGNLAVSHSGEAPKLPPSKPAPRQLAPVVSQSTNDLLAEIAAQNEED